MSGSLANASAGLGLRRALLGALQDAASDAFDFLECAPENWIGVGGKYGQALTELSARYPLTCHGLSLSLGGVEPLDETFLARVRRFLDQHHVEVYSEHLSYCTDDGHLYDLMPIPFTDEAVHHVAARIRRVQDILGRRIAVENVSYYAAPYQAMDEVDFVNAVLEEAERVMGISGCKRLRDVVERRALRQLLGAVGVEREHERVGLRIALQDDEAVPVQHSILMYEALIQNQVPVEMHLYPQGGHGFSLGINAAGTHKNWTSSCIIWMKQLGK